MAKELAPEEQALIDRKKEAAQAEWTAQWQPSTLFPLHSGERLFSLLDFFFLGLIAALPISILEFHSVNLTPTGHISATILAITLATLLMYPLAKVSQSYGLGSSMLYTGVFGQYGAKIIGILRAIWGALFFAENTIAMALLLHGLFIARFPNANILPFSFGRIPFSLNLLLLVVVFLVLQFLVLNKGIQRIHFYLKKTAIINLSGLVILAVWLFFASTQTTSPAVSPYLHTSFAGFSCAVGFVLLLLAPLIFSSPDLFRYSKKKASPAPFILGAGLATGQLIIFGIRQIICHFEGVASFGKEPLYWLAGSYQPIITWLVAVTLVAGIFLFNVIYNGYTSLMSAVLLRPARGFKIWSIILVALALPLYFLSGYFYSTPNHIAWQRGLALFFLTAPVLAIVYYWPLKKYRIDQNSLFYRPPNFLTGIKGFNLCSLFISSLLGGLVILLTDTSSEHLFIACIIFIIPIIASFGMLFNYFMPGLIKGYQYNRKVASMPLDRRPTPEPQKPVIDPAHQPMSYAPEASRTDVIITRMKRRQELLEQQEAQRQMQASHKNSKVKDNVKSWLE